MIRRTLARLATLRWRLTLFYVALLALLLGGFSLFVYNRFQESQKQNAISRLADMAAIFQPASFADDQLKQLLSTGNLGSSDEALKKLAQERLNQLAAQVS